MASVSFVDYSLAERNVQRYWNDIYYNQNGDKTSDLEQIVSTNIEVNATVSEDGTTKTTTIRSFKDLLPVISAISQAIVLDPKPELKLTIYNREVEKGNIKLSYHFEQILFVRTQEEGVLSKMTSKGTQIWTTATQGLLLAMDVKEDDKVAEVYIPAPVVPVTNLTGQDKRPSEAAAKGMSCILV